MAFAWSGTATATATVIEGQGEVLVNRSNSSSGGTFGQTSNDSKATSGWLLSGEDVKFYFHAKAKDSYTFAGWYKNQDGTDLKSASNPYNENASANQLTPSPSLSYFAVFKKIMTPSADARTIIKNGETGFIDVPVTFYNAANLSIKITDNLGVESTNVTCTGNTPSATGESNVTFRITAGANTQSGDIYKVIFTANDGKGNSATHTLTITVYDAVNVTYKAPINGGKYVVDHQDNSGTSRTLEIGSSDYSLQITNPDLSFKLTATATDANYRFSRWVITNNGDTINTSPVSPFVDYVPNDGDVVIAEFIEKKYAMFQVYNQGGVFYSDLTDGLRAAASSTNVLMVYQSGELKSGHYEIPVGVTLLVPGTDIVDNKATYRVSDVVLSDFTTASVTSRSCKKHLTMQPNTTIDVLGNVSVYAVMSQQQPTNGTPKTFGRISMADNCHMTFHENSVLSALGYITGNHETSSVTIKADATVYEAFQISDWRGGQATLDMAGLDYGALLNGNPSTAQGNAYDVFPVGQYYIQSVETKLILESGAVEKLATAVDMSIAPVEANALFVVPDSYGKYNGAYTTGLFRLGEGAQYEKYYDRDKDRQCIKIKGVELNNAYSTVKVDQIELVFNIGIDVGITTMNAKATIGSKTFTLPITNNIDLLVEDAYIETKSPLAFLAGSTMHVQEDSKIFVDADVYVYDKEQNTGYFYTADSEIIPVRYTPDGTHTGKRPDMYPTQDASWVIDGEMEIRNGALYTTSYKDGGNGKSENVLDYGANITSTGNGKVKYGKVASDGSTYQYSQVNSNYITIPVTNALLSNDLSMDANREMPYSAGNQANVTDVYTYVSSQGRWLLPQALTIARSDVEDFYLTLPEDDTKEVVCVLSQHRTNATVIADNFDLELSNGNNSRFEILSKSYGLDTDGNYKLRVQVKYKNTGIHNLETPYTDVLIVKAKDLTSGEYKEPVNVDLKAIEDYTPQFSLNIGSTNLVDGDSYSVFAYLGQGDTKPAVITAVEKNVTTLAATQWSSNATPSQYNFTFGSGAEKLSNAKLIYTPFGLNDPNGTLTITATYIDAASKSISNSINVTLVGSADKQPNSLTFVSSEATVVQGSNFENVFSNLGSGIEKITNITYDGASSHELVELVREGNNYKVVAKEVESIVEARTIEIVVNQTENDLMHGGSATLRLTVLPLAIWHWSNLYFESTYDSPVTPPQDGVEWTLQLLSCEEDLLTLTGDYQNGYFATIGTPSDASKTYLATFRFEQNGYMKEFSSNIYSDPRILSYCVTSERTYADITTSASGVTFDDAADQLTFAPASAWEFEMIGIPDEMTFTPTGSNTWMIQERASSNDPWTNVTSWTKLVDGQAVTFSLKPTTRQVVIKYGENTNTNGTICNLCVEKLTLKTNIQKLYLPVNKDATESVKSIVLTHASSSVPSVAVSNSQLSFEVLSTSNNLGTNEYPYYTTEVKVKTNANTPIDEEILVTATDGARNIQFIVRTYEFPQGLPIRLATDDPAERFYFVTTDSKEHAKWNDATRQLTLVNPGAQYVTRYVTFAFEGAPSVVKFNLSDINGNPIDIDSQHWTIQESTDGQFYTTAPSSKLEFSGNKFEQGLNYQTRYLKLEYSAMSLADVVLSNIVIEGYPHVIVDPLNIKFESDITTRSYSVTAINLESIRFELDNTTAFALTTDVVNYNIQDSEKATITTTENSHNNAYSHALGKNKVGDIVLGVKWLRKNAIDEGEIKIYNAKNDSLMAVITLLGADNYLIKGSVSGIYTGIPDGTIDPAKKFTFHNDVYTDYQYRQVDLADAFAADGKAMFDYLFIYGETTPASGTNITAPQVWSADGSTNVGSNAVTPYYIYRKAKNASGEYMGYEFIAKVDNANVADKAIVSGVLTADDKGTVFIDVPNSLMVYMTGFCPYATTGYTKNQEGVFLFRGKHGSKLDIYMEDFHVLSRNKTENGNAFLGKDGGDIFTDGYARGSGGVLVFENMDPQEELENYQPFDVTIHTKGKNMLNSNYGCFYGLSLNGSEISSKATQVSSPIHIHMYEKSYARLTKTTLNFDDKWPNSTTIDATGTFTSTLRTNGFLALKKQANNAPSIDMGNKHTTVNFYGGQIELHNSLIGSDTYKTTLAISHRSGYFGADEKGFQLCYGIGTDSVGGTVNFYDGTVTVRPMKVSKAYQQYYLMDPQLDSNGDTVKINGEVVYTDYTSCLRLPKNTYVYGGSHCFMRACQHVTSKGGAPKDGPTGLFLGQYIYTMQDGVDELDPNTKLAEVNGFPGNITGLREHQSSRGYTYGLESVTPDANSKLYFWIPDGFGGVTAEKDKYISIWKACMTEIGAGIQNVAEGSVGGDTPIEPNEEVKYFLYCQIDQNIHDVISAHNLVNDKEEYTYQAPIEVPAPVRPSMGTYVRWKPSYVGDSLQHEVLSDTTYTITDRVYYITTATADVWRTFTAPFDVANIYVVESYSENELIKYGAQAPESNDRQEILKEQAKHNADFAAFFGVAMAMGTDKSFDQIYSSYIEWAKEEDNHSDANGDYTLRGMQKLTPYFGNNWRDANFYLNKNTANWTVVEGVDEDGEPTYSFNVHWKFLNQSDTTDGKLLHKDSTYSIMFPYCPGCEDRLQDREYWDYWSGKFIIFESTPAPQTIKGRDFLNETKQNNIFTTEFAPNEVALIGNSTFARLKTDIPNVYIYSDGEGYMNVEGFKTKESEFDIVTVNPTTAFLYGYVPANQSGMPAKKVTREGRIIYGESGNNNGDPNNGTTTGSHTPTVGGDNDMFITAIDGGINIAVAAPQNICVVNATGHILYNGYVTTNTNVLLPMNGIYVVKGQNEVQKIFF